MVKTNYYDNYGKLILVGLLGFLLLLSIVITYVFAGSKVGVNKCTEGPDFWCSSESNYKTCVTDKSDGSPSFKEYCNRHIPLGTDNCTQGPDYWCGSKSNYKTCVVDKSSKPVLSYEDACFSVGKDNCTQGPDYWCALESNYQKCVVDKSSIPVLSFEDSCQKNPKLYM
jgi:hypothetical protein